MTDLRLVLGTIAVLVALWAITLWLDPPQPNVCPHRLIACVGP
jgi:hypothetical protein